MENYYLTIGIFLNICFIIFVIGRHLNLSYSAITSLVNSVILMVLIINQFYIINKQQQDFLALKNELTNLKEQTEINFAKFITLGAKNSNSMPVETGIDSTVPVISPNNFYSLLYSYADSPVGRGIVYASLIFLLIWVASELPSIKLSLGAVETSLDTVDYAGKTTKQVANIVSDSLTWIYSFFRRKPDGGSGGSSTNIPNLSKNSSFDNLSSRTDGLIRDMPSTEDALSNTVSNAIISTSNNAVSNVASNAITNTASTPESGLDISINFSKQMQEAFPNLPAVLNSSTKSEFLNKAGEEYLKRVAEDPTFAEKTADALIKLYG